MRACRTAGRRYRRIEVITCLSPDIFAQIDVDVTGLTETEAEEACDMAAGKVGYGWSTVGDAHAIIEQDH